MENDHTNNYPQAAILAHLVPVRAPSIPDETELCDHQNVSVSPQYDNLKDPIFDPGSEEDNRSKVKSWNGRISEKE